MNQIVSFDRVVYFGWIQEKHRDPKLLNHPDLQYGPKWKPALAFGTRAPGEEASVNLPSIKRSDILAAYNQSPNKKPKVGGMSGKYSHKKALNYGMYGGEEDTI